MKFLLLIILLLSLSHAVLADDNVVQVSADGSSSSDSPAKARSESLKEALNKGSLQVIGQLIGETKLDKNMPVIKGKILQEASKFIQFYKASEPIKKGEDTVTSVTMKISISSLRDVLSQEGVLNQSEGPATVLPVIRVIEKRDNGRQYRWWTEELNGNNAFLREQERLFLKQFDTLFRAKNFYLLDPVSGHYVQWMPQPYRLEAPGLNDLMWMGTFFKAQVIIAGDAIVSQATSGPEAMQLEIKLTAYNSGNGRVVGEVTRNFETTGNDWDMGVQNLLKKSFSEVSKDLTSQVFEEFNRGTLGANLLRIALHGNFNFQDLESFKKQILAKTTDIKTIRERRLEHGIATFEVDSAGGLPGLAKILETTSFEGFKVSVQELVNNQVDVHWAKVGTN